MFKNHPAIVASTFVIATLFLVGYSESDLYYKALTDNGGIVAEVVESKSLPPEPHPVDEIRPDGIVIKRTRYEYDSAGRLSTIFHGSGARTDFKYDAAGNCTRKTTKTAD